MISIRLASIHDVQTLVPKDMYKFEEGAFERALGRVKRKEAVIVCYKGEAGCLLGAEQVWPGVVEVWAITTNELYKYPTVYARALKRLCNDAFSDPTIHRMQMYVRNSVKDAVQFSRFLGFEPEGLLRKYGMDKGDYLIMGRTK